MKNKGFTLIEMLGVIVVLSLLVVIGAKSISTIVKKSKVELSELQVQSIIDSAKNLSNDNSFYMPTYGKCKYITYDDLYEYGYIIDDDINQEKNNEYKKIYVSICANKNKLLNKISYDYEFKYLDELDKPEVGMNPFFLAEPDLYNNSLTPIVYVRLTYTDSSHTGTPNREILNGTEVITATSDTEVYEWQVPYEDDVWYDYPNQMWANAVILDNGVEKSPGDTVDIDTTDGFSDAIGMFVWIPRYSYTLKCENEDFTECYGNYDNAKKINASTTRSINSKGAIDIKFVGLNVRNNGIAKYTNTTKKNWLTMPAFTLIDDDKVIELDGLWIGKFNISAYDKINSKYITTNIKCYTEFCGSEGFVRTLPKTKILVNNPHASYYNLIKNVSNYYNLESYLDTHMIKNSEWSVASYLSQSVYGKYGNMHYNYKYKKIYMNNDDNYITGKSNGNIGTYATCINSSDEFSNGCEYQLNYDNIINVGEGMGELGAGASTTGNIYGIYDMVGAGYEYVMFNADNEPAQSLFTKDTLSNMSLKYIDKFDLTEKKCNNSVCLGYSFDTTNYDIVNSFSLNNSFCVMGTYVGITPNSEIFTIYSAHGPGAGNGGPHNTTRVAIFKSN